MSQDPSKKIIVDEDWKSQVEAEKKAAEEGGEQPQPSGGAPSLPPADLSYLLTTIATQAMMTMGMVPNPATGEVSVDLDFARHFIDTLEMLGEKTEGNRTPEESQILDGMLHELRMGFVAVKNQQGAQE